MAANHSTGGGGVSSSRVRVSMNEDVIGVDLGGGSGGWDGLAVGIYRTGMSAMIPSSSGGA